jgi:hypothetical protein
MKTNWGEEVKLHAFLTSVFDESEWSASRPGRFVPWVRAPVALWIAGWVGGGKEQESNHCSCRQLNSGRPARTEWTTSARVQANIGSENKRDWVTRL